MAGPNASVSVSAIQMQALLYICALLISICRQESLLSKSKNTYLSLQFVYMLAQALHFSITNNTLSAHDICSYKLQRN